MKPIERGSAEHTRRMNGYMGEVAAMIAQHGWMIQGVFPVEPDAGLSKAFCYTVGMTGSGLPELLLGALPNELAAPMLNASASRHLEEPLVPGEVWEVPGTTVTNPLKLKVLAMPDGHPWLGMAYRLYGRSRVSGLQLLWCDQNGMFPGDALYSAHHQPLAVDEPVQDPPRQRRADRRRRG